MSLIVKKLQQGGRFLKRGNDRISVDDLIRESEKGLDDWLSKHRVGKHKESIRNAYRSLIDRLNTNPESLTYNIGGGFTDSTGELANSGSGFDDLGVAAGYLGSIIRNMPVYKDPNKTEYSRNNPLMTENMYRSIFGADPTNFVLLDPESNGQRGIANRVAKTIEGLGNLKNTIDQYYDFTSDDDRNYALNQLDTAINVLQNGDPNDDWYQLGQLGVGNLKKLFYTGEATPSMSQAQQLAAAGAGNVQPTGDFDSWIAAKYPLYTGQPHNPIVLTTSTNSDLRDSFLSGIQNADNATLQNWLGDYLKAVDSYNLNNNSYMNKILPGRVTNFDNKYIASTLLNNLKRRGLLTAYENNPNIFYIPNSDTNGLGYIWDAGSNILSQQSIHNIPYWQKRIVQEFKSQQPATQGKGTPYRAIYSRYGVYKDGGVLKFDKGGSTPNDWYTGLIDYDVNNYTSDYDTSKLVNMDFSNTDRTPWNSSNASTLRGRYKPSAGNSREYTQGVENSDYYKQFGNDLFDANGNFTKVGEAWAKMVDQQLPQGSAATFYDENGQLRKSWNPQGRDAYNRVNPSPNPIYNLRDYVNYLRNDQTLGARHNGFAKVGKRYFYKDSNGTKHWVDPSQIDKYQVSENPVETSVSDDKTTTWNDYELTGLKPVDQSTPQSTNQPNPTEAAKDPSQINETNVGEKIDLSKYVNGFTRNLKEHAPDAIAALRFAMSLRNNAKNKRIAQDSMKPVLADPMDLHSPVTGDYAARQEANKAAATIQRNANRAVTSDASLNQAQSLQGARDAAEYTTKGALQDNAMIQKTMEDSRNREEKSREIRNQVANQNKQAINANIREKADIEAKYNRSNYDSTNLLLGQMEQKAMVNNERDKQFAAENLQTQLSLERQNQANLINDKYQAWKKAQPEDADTSLQAYDEATNGEYTKAVQALNAYFLQKGNIDTQKLYGYNAQGYDLKPFNINDYHL